MTFLGFKITPNGDLVDPETNRVMEQQLLTKELRKGLSDQKVNFDENYFTWDRLINVYICSLHYYSFVYVLIGLL